MKALLLIAFAGCGLAQSADPRVQRLVDDYVKAHPAFGGSVQSPVKTLSGVLPSEAGKPCSVPLIEMQIPNDVEFTMRKVGALKDPQDRIQASVPAPACSR